MARVQELVTSCLISGPLGLYVCSCLAPPRISHCEKKGGGKSFKVPGSIEENMRLCPNKHTFLLVLTCISKSLMRCSWKQIRYTCKRSYAHRKVCRHKRVHTQTHRMMPDAHHLFSLSRVSTRSSMFRFGHVETSGND